MLDAARHAPRGPDVEQPNLAFHVLGCEGEMAVVELLEPERRGGLADEGRGHLARVVHQPRGEEAREQQEEGEGDRELEESHALSGATCGAGRAGTKAGPGAV